MKYLVFLSKTLSLAILISLLVVAPISHAVETFDESFAMGNDVFYYQPGEECIGGTTGSSLDGEVTIAQANIKSNNYKGALDLITKESPDFISLNEVHNASPSDLAPAGYSVYKDPDAVGEERSTAVVWSDKWTKKDAGRITIVNDGPQKWDKGRSFTWVTLNSTDGGTVSMISIHHMINPRYHGPNMPQRQQLYKDGLLKLTEKVAELSTQGPVFVAGDFNSRYVDNDPWGPRKILGDANLKSSFDTLGSIPTHDGDGTIDYIFAPNNMTAVSQKTLNPGDISDHLFLVAKFKGADTGSNTTSDTQLSGSDNREKAFNYFMSKGLTDKQSAAIIGNMVQESGVDPENTQTGFTPDRTKDPTIVSRNSKGEQGGWGIIQWTPSSKVVKAKADANASGEIYTLGTQLDIVWGHLNNKPPITTGQFNISDYKNITTTEEAVLYFEKHIEGAGEPVLGNRINFANTVLKDYGGNTASPTPVTSGCSEGDQSSSSTPSDLGIGKGSFTDSGDVKNFDTILNNAKMSEEAFGDKLVNSGYCATITSGVWHNAAIAYGYNYAEDAFYQNPGIRHADRKPKRGAILIYGSQSDTKAGHVVIYLGSNKILNDGHIADAQDVEGWGGGYLGWIDPNDLGWNTSKGTKQSVRDAVVGNIERLGGSIPPGV